mgnify:CR=1 FL=1
MSTRRLTGIVFLVVLFSALVFVPALGERLPLCMDDPPGVRGREGALPLARGDTPQTARIDRQADELRPLQATLRMMDARTVVDAVEVVLPAAEAAAIEEAAPATEAFQPAQPQTVAPIPNIQVEGLLNNSGWVTTVADDQGNLYTAFEYAYAIGCGGTCYATIAGKSRDNGRTWDLWYVVASTTESARRPTIAVDSNGQLYIAMELYFNGASGLRWYAAVAKSACPRDVSSWSITYWNTTYALVPGGTDADAGGDGNDFYAQFGVPYDADGRPDILTVWSLDGGVSWSEGFLYTSKAYNIERPTTQVGTANVSCSFYYGGATRYWYYGAIGGNCARTTRISQADAAYADGDGSGAYHYVVYQQSNDIYIRYSTNDGVTFSAEVGVDTADDNQTYPAVSANGAKVRVAYINGGNQTLLRTSDNNGASWSSAYTLNTGGNTTVNGFHYVGLAYHPIGGAADGRHPIAMWVDNRNTNYNIYLGTINDRPAVGTLAWPANGATITAFAPSLRWNAGSDPDGDTLRYYWYVDTTNGSTLVGGPVAMLESLPYYTSPGTTCYWKVQATDGYELSGATAVFSFTLSNEVLSGSPGRYSEEFTTEPLSWTRKSFACLDCFEGNPIRWAVDPAGRWVRSTDYAWSGAYSARVLYDANNADYRMTSPSLDLRGSEWAFFNTYFRGSSESGYDFLYLESRPTDATPCWAQEDALSGNYNTGWWTYYEGAIDLSTYAHTNSSQVRLRFVTDGSNYGGSYGVGWYEDETRVLRQSAWSWDSSGFYRLQASEGAWTGYPDNTVDLLYSPHILLPDHAGLQIHLEFRERYALGSGDLATVWVYDVAADTWQLLASYSGTQSSWNTRTLLIPESYKGRVVVIALVLRTDGSGTLLSPQETGGYWDVDAFVVEERNPTAVELSEFRAAVRGRDVRLLWSTASELDLVGFNLYRSTRPGGPYVRLNSTLIPAQRPGSPIGASYSWLDRGLRLGRVYYYRLEQVDMSGATTQHGPLEVRVGERAVPVPPTPTVRP